MRKIFSAMLVSLAMMLTVCKGPEEEQVGTARSEVAPVVESAGKGKPAGKKHPTKAWILACRVHGRGFGCFPGDSAFVTRTGMACEALDEMGELESLPGKEELVAWLKSRQQPDGGFLEAGDYYKNKLLPWGSMSALEPTYWAVKTLRLLGAEPERPQDAARFVKARQMPGGAFDSYEIGWNRVRTSEMLYSTFWGVGALKELGVPVPDSARIVEWIRSKQDTSTDMGGFNLGDKILAYYTAQGTYYAVRTLALLGAEPGRSAAIVKKFLLSDRGQEADGGFEMGHGDDWNNYDHYSRMVDTYAAVCALALLGTPLSDSDSSRA
ncbi:MAG: prenyltransferase/squalene oxidase repeat-containing protein, partial [Gemmatimonadota bacterium]|nr:prenyltransferase/squalene oxidase repeat-containing protein [Gemmatimonadota bacterium]